MNSAPRNARPLRTLCDSLPVREIPATPAPLPGCPEGIHGFRATLVDGIVHERCLDCGFERSHSLAPLAVRPIYTPCPVADCQDAECEHTAACACMCCGAPLTEDEARASDLDHRHPPTCDDCWLRATRLAQDLRLYSDLRGAGLSPPEAMRSFSTRRAS